MKKFMLGALVAVALVPSFAQAAGKPMLVNRVNKIEEIFNTICGGECSPEQLNAFAEVVSERVAKNTPAAPNVEPTSRAKFVAAVRSFLVSKKGFTLVVATTVAVAIAALYYNGYFDEDDNADDKIFA